MLRKDDGTTVTATATAAARDIPSSKRIRFRGDLNNQNFDGHIEDILDDSDDRKKCKNDDVTSTDDSDSNKEEKPSFYDFIKIELTRGYILEHDEERYSARRQKIYSFMKIPREVEKFMIYAVIQCADSFLYIHTFLPIRYCLALWAFISRPILNCFGLRRRTQRLLTPAEMCDLLKGSIWILCTLIMLSVDTNRMYHIIKTQSIIKLYIFYNMLEVGDRLLSAFGQDTIDALFWTATEPKNKRREHFGLIPHIIFALTYVILHSFLIMFQATTLNVAVNSNNKSFLTIMISNNFVELKGSVFKKFDKNNLFQLTCSDVRERFHLSILLFIVVIQTMKEFNWSLDQFYVMLPDCYYVMITEILIDWIKHAFITRFNELPVDVYREYTISLAYDMTQTRQKHAFSDHSDLVARRMGFIPFPLSVVLIKAVYSAVSFDNAAAYILFIFAYFTLVACRVLNIICALGKACDLMKEHQKERNHQQQQSTMPSGNLNTANDKLTMNTGLGNTNVISSTPKTKTQNLLPESVNVSPVIVNHSLQRSQTIDVVEIKLKENNIENRKNDSSSSTSSLGQHNNCRPSTSLTLGATALFSNSDVDLDDVCLNEKILNANSNTNEIKYDEDQPVTRSVPDLQQQIGSNDDDLICGGVGVGGGGGGGGGGGMGGKGGSEGLGTHNTNNNLNDTSISALTRTHKRSESEPSFQSILNNDKDTSS